MVRYASLLLVGNVITHEPSPWEEFPLLSGGPHSVEAVAYWYVGDSFIDDILSLLSDVSFILYIS